MLIATSALLVGMAVAAASAVSVDVTGAAGVEEPALVSPEDLSEAVPSVPSVPSVPDVPSVPSTPELPTAPSVPSTPSVPSLPSSPGGSGTTTGSGGGSGGGGSADPGGGPGSDASAPTAAGGNRGGHADNARARTRRGDGATRSGALRSRRERRLRESVTELAGCLPALGGIEQRVLELRAGVDGRALSRGETGNRLDLSGRAVRRSERRGLRRLESLGSTGACGSSSGSESGGLLGASFPGLEPLAAFADPPKLVSTTALAFVDTPAERQEVLAASASSDDSLGDGQSSRVGGFAAAPVPGGPVDDVRTLPMLMLVFVGVTGVLMLVLLTRRNRPHVYAAPDVPPMHVEHASTAAHVEPAPEPAPKPAPRPPLAVTPVEPARNGSHPRLAQAAKPAAIIASGAASLLLGHLARSRTRSRGRHR